MGKSVRSRAALTTSRYGIAGFTTSIASLKAIREITWADAAFDVGGFALFAVLAYLLFRLLRLPNRVDLAPLR